MSKKLGKRALAKSDNSGSTDRKKLKYPNLNPRKNLNSRREEILDLNSYVDQLNEAEKEWLNKFAGEYINCSYNAQDLSKNLHNTPELKKSLTDKNNAKNRCILGRAQNINLLDSIDDLKDKELTTLIPENSFKRDVDKE